MMSEQEFSDKVTKVVNCIADGQRNSECGNLLREIYLDIFTSAERKSFSNELLKQLKSLIVEPGDSPKALRLLAVSILRELSPTVAYNVRVSNLSADPNWLPLVFPLILTQGQELGYIEEHIPMFLKWLKSSPNPSFQRSAFLCLMSIHNHYGMDLFSEEHVTNVNKLMIQWLSNASRVSAPNPYQRAIFNSKTMLQPVTEVDGKNCESFFTVLNIAHYCTMDQWLNIAIFSSVRWWLLTTWSYQNGFCGISTNIPCDLSSMRSESPIPFAQASFVEPIFFDERNLRTQDANDTDEDLLSSPLPSNDSYLVNSPNFSEIGQAFDWNAASTPIKDTDENRSVSSCSNLSGMRRTFGSESSFFSESSQDGSLVEKTIAYCYRLLQQTEHNTTTLHDVSLQKACVIEAVSLLDFFCEKEADLIPRAIQAVRKVYNHVKKLSEWVEVLLPILLFYIKYGEAVILDAEPYIRHFFEDILYNSFTSPELAFEIVDFCIENKEELRQSTNIFSKYFPNIFKIIAWFPRTFLKEFMELLPMMINENNYVEIFHLLLDLPCLSAALEAVHESKRRSVKTNSESIVVLRKSVKAYNNSKFRGLFSFILRKESGFADTISRLNILHSLFEDMVNCPRVLTSAQVSWLLLRVYFQEVLQNKDIEETKLFPILLERVVSIIDIEEYKNKIQSLFASQLLSIFKLHPDLLFEYSSDIIDFVQEMKTLDTSSKQFFTNLVWIIGEYASNKYDVRYDNSCVIKFHEIIESVTYELASRTNADSKLQKDYCTSRLLCILMSTLAKLASRCPDLIPKVILCIRKVSKQRADVCVEQAEKATVMNRARELISLLNIPSVAQLILSPDPSIKEGRLHRDRHTSLSFFMNSSRDMMF
ncbi:AP-5 complex subunit zeta-1-like [Xenia sp. Carnegie-2017]|uniref:AP-5 complex subunit zeta-1-like n=1 Tax=Xenia sp. Carnegie-2017 TaxID=2897299 RepID=UPI001F039DE7|nr:AP-5 complex subunit zeta-1-like [Xenia sp. Carnegie-2017]XP_046855731.1 AP-5 complex subunit zeta-1-like [Xenia sp. Carnegie-2017]